MKIIAEHKSTPQTMDGRMIEPGTVFRGKVSRSYEPSLYLRTWDQIVDLANPRCVWSMGERGTSFDITDYIEHDAEIIDKGPKR